MPDATLKSRHEVDAALERIEERLERLERIATEIIRTLSADGARRAGVPIPGWKADG